MNIQNISALAEQLKTLGYENTGYPLLKRIIFKPENFFLIQKVEKGKDHLNFYLHFEKDVKPDTYILVYYDAILQKESAFPEVTIAGINTADLEKQMSGIDWKKAFNLDEKKLWNPDDKPSWETESKIEMIMDQLAGLEVSEEGKLFAASLKLKYWAGTSYQELLGNISPQKNRSEVSQRFYLSNGEPGISVDEAYRFLQNKWMEKQMQAKRKQLDSPDEAEPGGSSQGSVGSGLLRKRRINSSTKNKRNKTIQE